VLLDLAPRGHARRPEPLLVAAEVVEAVELQVLRHLEELAVTRLAAHVVEVLVLADEVRIVETGFDRLLEVVERAGAVSLSRESAGAVVERSALPVAARGGRLERLGREVEPLRVEEILSDVIESLSARGRRGLRPAWRASGRRIAVARRSEPCTSRTRTCDSFRFANNACRTGSESARMTVRTALSREVW
jgi:hypothetical protein